MGHAMALRLGQATGISNTKFPVTKNPDACGVGVSRSLELQGGCDALRVGLQVGGYAPTRGNVNPLPTRHRVATLSDVSRRLANVLRRNTMGH